ncbi:hypothetical protein C3941_11325 [Kaistia algarum]|uniref:GNAT family N-acetyltransferase n=1 Tax=Kaistia algarum TaxID=2083279 RepID=UPI000CE79A6A|nr:GNAT family N-acetyltransferase [Kaistia algarum]MCX5514937.1 GNAT family N-acetyltransferase [Kaistia algarum]PPE79685.1 hypothetical protein C3941_11325 [Kaistia algarum]
MDGSLWTEQAEASGARSSGQARSGLTIEILPSPSSIETEWRGLAAKAKVSIYQQFGWTNAWAATIAPAQHIIPSIMVLRLAGQIAAILPLGIERAGLLRIARFPGGEHANIRMPIVDHDCMDALVDSDALGQRIVAAMQVLPERVDLIDLDALPLEWLGRPVPLANHPAARPARLQVGSIALGTDLAATLEPKRRSRKAKKHRAQLNALAPIGGYRFYRAPDALSAIALFERFRAEKSEWFAKMGIGDSFAGPGVPEFFHALIERRWQGDDALLDLYAVEFGGAVRAILGGGAASGRMSGYFLSVADDEWRRITPGELLLHDLVEACCAEGLSSLDLGRGDERYKTSWLTSEEKQVRLILPVTAAGHAGLAALRLRHAAERKLRDNPRLWQLAKRIRRILGGHAPAAPEPEAAD